MKVVPIVPPRVGEIEIDLDVPLPMARRATASFPLAKLAVGHSFNVSRELAPQLKNAVRTYSTRTGRKFTTRTTSNGTRVWRIK